MDIHRDADYYIYIATAILFIALIIASITNDVILWRIFSAFGEELAYIALSILIYIFIDPYTGLTLISLTILSGSINILLKYTLNLPRPPRELWKISESGPGFPSGHSQISSTFWTFICIEMKSLSMVVLSISILISIALSRIFLGVHYWYDVVGGLAIGIAITSTSILILRRFDERKTLAILNISTFIVSLYNVYMGHEIHLSLALVGLSIGFTLGYKWITKSVSIIRNTNIYGKIIMFIAIVAIAIILREISSISPAITPISYILIALSILSIPILYEKFASREKGFGSVEAEDL
ncbi:phosphoesterase PA-phosphatase related [Ignisphaera aggregans DSM 17230]|uniref:Phosphoesterase PA-phosphatase related n=1 Tax=Ignisphaera aggregans (strain DSM 17230 / JCM 13409 / AQ1.S1) TaxID=583356 RepID=E0SRW8_IGNAA|nr:phosphoesterase PA-phosphatase related [Ignisphaera aggregans DSM 17230]